MKNIKGMIPEILDSFEEMKAIRHDIHTHPELGFEEYRTSNIVVSCLEKWGYKVSTGIGKTGVIGSLTVGDGNRHIGIRADMDALPIQEDTRLSYTSQNKGLMHACGHDGHTATLLAVAKYLADTKQFSGTVHLIFQPSEEKDAGALAMIKDGLFDIAPCNLLFCMHNYPTPDLKVGQMCLNQGVIMGSTDSITIRIIGKGCHAASPHFGKDPIVASASIIQALQSIISRNASPFESAALSITSIHAGNTFNIIPEDVELKLSLRTLDEKQRQWIKKRITEVVKYQAKSFGVESEITYQGEGYPVLINSAQATEFARKIAMQFFSQEYINTEYKPILASDDFAFMAQEVPSCYINAGNGNTSALHNAKYDFNDNLIPIMASFWGHLVENFLVTEDKLFTQLFV